MFLIDQILLFFHDIYNFLIDLKTRKEYVISDLPELNEIRKQALARTDINDHLETLFIESMAVRPKLIVELGTRGGESTFVLERVAKLSEGQLVSVDIEDCSSVCAYQRWKFVKKDDVAFAGEFKDWCQKQGFGHEIDILFIDTSHKYQHTAQEIEAWFPFLSGKAKVFFHDTNLGRVNFRKDGSLLGGWNNRRGVIRALEKYFNKRFNERVDFTDSRNGWQIKHFALCNGFTILNKMP